MPFAHSLMTLIDNNNYEENIYRKNAVLLLILYLSYDVCKPECGSPATGLIKNMLTYLLT